MEKIENRIVSLEKELEGLMQRINQISNTLSDLKTEFVRKQGALEELKNIISIK